MNLDTIREILLNGGSVDCLRAGIFRSRREWHAVIDEKVHSQPPSSLVYETRVKRRTPTCPDCLLALGIPVPNPPANFYRALAKWIRKSSGKSEARDRARRRHRQAHRRR